jgi:hypothetical protein
MSVTALGARSIRYSSSEKFASPDAIGSLFDHRLSITTHCIERSHVSEDMHGGTADSEGAILD